MIPVLLYDPYSKTSKRVGEPEKKEPESIVPDVESVLVEEPKKTTKRKKKAEVKNDED